MRIGLVKTSSLGDIVQCLPLLSLIKTLEPDADILWIVEKPFSEIVSRHPLIDHVFVIESKKWRKSPFSWLTWGEIRRFRSRLKEFPCDMVIDLQGNFKSGLAASCLKSPRKIGYDWSSAPEWLNLFFTNEKYTVTQGLNIRSEYKELVLKSLNKEEPPALHPAQTLKLTSSESQRLTELLSRPPFTETHPVIVAPSSQWINKQLPVETLIQVLDSLGQRHGYTYGIIWGNPAEKQCADLIASRLKSASSVIDRQCLPVLQHLMNHSERVISMDSLPLHLAASVDTPTLSFFGPSSSVKYKPQGDMHLAFQGECPYGKAFEKRCPILRTCKTGACLREQSASKIISEI